MELKINLDMDKIDYDAINKEILNKIKEADVLSEYRIEEKITSTTSVLIRDTVRDYINIRYGDAELSRTGQDRVRELFDDISKEELILRLNKVFESMTDEDFKKMFANIFPNVMYEVMHNYVYDKLTTYFADRECQRYEIVNQLRDELHDRGLI